MKRVTYFAVIAVSFLLFALACPKKPDTGGSGSDTPEPDVTQTSEDGEATPEATPMASASGGAMILTATDALLATRSDGNWTLEAVLRFPNPVVAAASDDTSLWVVTTEQVIGFDNTFQRISRSQRFQPDEGLDAEAVSVMTPFRRKAALDVAGGEAFVSEGSQFYVVSGGNVMTGNLNLPKTAHDVMVHGDVAYLVDDIMRPLFIHRVDISDTTKPRVSSKQELKLVGGHLGVQWLDAEREQWYVTTSSSHRTGTEVGLHTTPLGGAEAVTRTLWKVKRPGNEPVGEAVWEPESALWRVTESVPAWGLMRKGEAFFVVRLGNDEDPAAVADEWKIPGAVSETVATGFAKNDDLLFVAVERTLYVLDVSGSSIELQARITLPDKPVDIVAW